MLEDEDRCRKAGCSDFLPKPVNLDDLLRLVEDRLTPSAKEFATGFEKASPMNLPAASVIDETITALEGQLAELCQSYFDGNYEQVSVKSASFKQLVAKANHPVLESASLRLLQNATARNADGIEQAITDVTVMLQELQSSRKNSPQIVSGLGGWGEVPLSRHERRSKAGAMDREETVHTAPADEPLRSSLPLDDPVFREIVQGFVDRLHSQVAAMEAAFEANNFQELAFLAHWLKGAGGTMGFAGFTAPAKRLEDSAKAGHREPSSLALTEIKDLAHSIVLE
jgi:hypothetical protein